MKYIFTNDFYYFKKKYLTFYLLFLLVNILFPMYLKMILNIDFSEQYIFKIYKINLGIDYGNFSLIEYFIFIINIAFFVFVAQDIFSKDFNFGKEYIFLRMSLNKWILLKLLYNIIFTICISSLEFFLVSYTYILCGFKLKLLYIVKILFIDIFLKIILQILSLIFVNIFEKNSFLIIILIYTLPWININYHVKQMFKFIFIDYYMYNFKMLFLILGIELLMLFIIRKKFLLKFERS